MIPGLSLLVRTGFASDERGASFNVGYTITVGITAILLIGVIIGVGVVLDGQQDRAVTHQVDVIGDQVASGVMATDRLGEVGEGANATVTRELPSEVVGTPYHVRLADTSEGEYLVVDAVDSQYEAMVPIDTEAEVRESSVYGGVTAEIVHEIDHDTGERTVHLQPKGQHPSGVEAEDKEFFAVNIEDISHGPAEEGDSVTVESHVENTGDEFGDQEVTLDIVGFGEVDSESVSLDPGESETIELEWSSSQRSGEFEGAHVETGDSVDFQTFDVEADESDPLLTVHDFDVSDKTDEDEFATEVTIEEEHDVEPDDLDVELIVTQPDGTEVYDETVEPGDFSGDELTITFGEDHGTPELGEFTADTDEYTITATADASNADSDSNSDSFEVTAETEPEEFNVDVVDDPSEVDHDDNYDVEVEVTNTGDESGTQDIELEIDDEGQIDTESLDLDGGDSETVTLTWDSNDHSPGDYTGGVSSDDTSDTVSVTIDDDAPARPEFTSTTVEDDSTVFPPGQAGVEYDASFIVDDPDDRFDRVEIEFENHDTTEASETLTSSSETGSVTHDPGQANFGEDYTITFRLYDEDGEVEEGQVVIDDIADGGDP